MIQRLAGWTLTHGWFGYWLPGFLSGLATGGIVALLLLKAVQP